MKKFLLFILIGFISTIKAQVVFCPPGAEWNYDFFQNGIHQNETVKYDRDTLVGTDVFKVLTHTRHFLFCNTGLPPAYTTLIKQSGDTIFFKNSLTQQSWQILYNFAAQTGWQTNLLTLVTSFTPSPKTHTFVVQSTDQVVINTKSLKRLTMANGQTVVERIGNTRFLFAFSNLSTCHYDILGGMLCYKDDEFGTKQFTVKPCDYTEVVGVKENKFISGLKIFPNPVTSELNVQFEDVNFHRRFELLNVLGEIVLAEQEVNENMKVDLSNFQKGIYFLKVFENRKLVLTQKIIKE